jgi:hypothetical protein
MATAACFLQMGSLLSGKRGNRSKIICDLLNILMPVSQND